MKILDKKEANFIKKINNINFEFWHFALTNKHREAQIKAIHLRKIQQRNEMCKCGSGKKYKYCCLNKRKKTLSFWKWLISLFRTPKTLGDAKQ